MGLENNDRLRPSQSIANITNMDIKNQSESEDFSENCYIESTIMNGLVDSVV